MKSIINAPEIKQKILKAVEKALDDCAYQHEYFANNNEADYEQNQPVQLDLKFKFNFSDKDGLKGKLYCQPIINLNIKD